MKEKNEFQRIFIKIKKNKNNLQKKGKLSLKCSKWWLRLGKNFLSFSILISSNKNLHMANNKYRLVDFILAEYHQYLSKKLLKN